MLDKVVESAHDWIGTLTKIKPSYNHESITLYKRRMGLIKSLTEIAAFLSDVQEDIKNDRFNSDIFKEDLNDLESDLVKIYRYEDDVHVS